MWDSTYGSKNRDALATAKITKDGGIILGGSSYSPRYGDKSEDFLGNNDYWVVKLDSTGHEQWDKTIGGSLSDYLTSIDLVANNGYILAGYSNSPKSFNKTKACKGTFLTNKQKEGGLMKLTVLHGLKESNIHKNSSLC